MNLDRRRMDAILEQSDEELLPRVRVVMDVLGLTQEQRDTLLSDLPLLRQKAREVSEFDLYRARLLLGEEQLENLIRILEREHG
ncbi:MAG: hypothetical protein IJF24_01535 [Clostridia bacterium]|nr:hypothetical protein [Clostridia bacterium]